MPVICGALDRRSTVAPHGVRVSGKVPQQLQHPPLIRVRRDVQRRRAVVIVGIPEPVVDVDPAVEKDAGHPDVPEVGSEVQGASAVQMIELRVEFPRAQSRQHRKHIVSVGRMHCIRRRAGLRTCRARLPQNRLQHLHAVLLACRRAGLPDNPQDACHLCLARGPTGRSSHATWATQGSAPYEGGAMAGLAPILKPTMHDISMSPNPNVRNGPPPEMAWFEHWLKR